MKNIDKIQKELKRIADKIGKVPNKREWDQNRSDNMPSEWTIRHHGQNWSQLLHDTFPDFGKEELTFVRSNYDDKVGHGKGKKRYVVSAVVPGALPNIPFLMSIKNYCKKMSAELILLPTRSVTKKECEYDEYFEKYEKHFFSEYKFNSNLIAMDLKISPQQVNPLGGLNRIGQKDYSVILASPKQQMTTVPTSNTKLPHILHSTGAITMPNYTNDKVGRLAHQDHIAGALVVEVQDNELFHMRQIQADVDGSFYDLNKQYWPSGAVKTVQAEALILGDIHAGEDDPGAVSAWNEAASLVKPKRIILHDIFTGNSINPHTRHNLERQANKPSWAKDLRTELDICTHWLKSYAKSFPKSELVVVRSNHDIFLDRYLQDGEYTKHPENYKLALQLALWHCDGKNPLEAYIGSIKNVKWLRLDDDYKVDGVQLAAHGHIGANGAKGSAAGLELSYGNAVIGHSHSPKIIRKLWQVGTSTHLQLDYNRGPSSWLAASCILYKSGFRQMIIAIDGKWRI